MKCLVRVHAHYPYDRPRPGFRPFSQAIQPPRPHDAYENFTAHSTMKPTTMTAAMTSMARRGTRASRRSVAG